MTLRLLGVDAQGEGGTLNGRSDQVQILKGGHNIADNHDVVIKKFKVAANSIGEAVLYWSVSDPGTVIETCVVIATFNGVTAPLGAVPARPGFANYEFADRVLNAYVGTKVYNILFVHYDGTISLGTKHASIDKNTNIPLRYVK